MGLLIGLCAMAAPAVADLPPEEEGVCVRVRIQINQEVAITRSAFRATLEINNAPEGVVLENLRVTLDIRNLEQEASNDLFGILGPEVTGASDVDGTGVIDPGGSATALWTIIPTRDAAPFVPIRYWVGGTLSYTEGENAVTIPLFPAHIWVKPDPSLVLHYFLVRDVFSDDPRTPEIEPTEPFPLGLIMINQGRGSAHKVRITSSQPKIIENEKGLLIDFTIIGTQVNTDQVSPSLTVKLGDIDPGQTAVAQWLMTCSLQGAFIEYQATFEQVNDLGDPRLSLIDSVDIHELNHAVLVDVPDDDYKPDFLANDVEDDDHLPDTLYNSDGSTATVNVGLNAAVLGGPVTYDNLEVGLSADVTDGWVYIQAEDPGQEQFRLAQVVRSDGRQIRVAENAWTTHRTYWFKDEPAPFRQHLVHIFDKDSTGSYTLIYAGPDRDGDQVPDNEDNCPEVSNPDQKNTDKANEGLPGYPAGDDRGDACDNDDDNDGLTDGDEVTVYHTDPLDPDSDDDTYGDKQEVDAGSDPNNANSIPNQPPYADAGPERNVLTGQSVVMNGSESYDPEGALVTYLWTFKHVPGTSQLTDGDLSDALDAKPSFTPDVDGAYTLELTVSDGAVAATDEVSIIAGSTNVAPNANAGPDENALTGTRVYLDGAGAHDPDHFPDPLTFVWSFDLLPDTSTLSSTDISDRDQTFASFVPDVAGLYRLELQAYDGQLYAQDTVEVLAASADVAPNAHAGEDATIQLGEPAFLYGLLSHDPDNGPQPLSYNWRFVGLPSGSALDDEDLFGANQASALFVPDDIGTYVARLMVGDGAQFDFDNVAITVLDGACQGDLDNDGDVDGSDLAALVAEFGATNCNGTCKTDLNGDNNVDDADLAAFASQLGRTDCRPVILPCEGDLDNDGDTDGADLAAFMDAFGSSSEDVAYNPDADFNGDGFVDRLDLVLFAMDYGRTGCPQ